MYRINNMIVHLLTNFFTVQILLHGIPMYLSGGILQSEYVFEQMHFHWGAEHTINGLRDALELHLVHYDKQYANISVAMQHENGLAVVAVLFKVDITFVRLLFHLSSLSTALIVIF